MRREYVNYIKDLLTESKLQDEDEMNDLSALPEADNELMPPEEDGLEGEDVQVDDTEDMGDVEDVENTEDNTEEQPAQDNDVIVLTLRELVLKQLLEDELSKLGIAVDELPEKLQASLTATGSEFSAIENEQYPDRLKKVNSAIVELFKKVASEINVTNSEVFDSLALLKGGLKITGEEVEPVDELVERVKEI